MKLNFVFVGLIANLLALSAYAIPVNNVVVGSENVQLIYSYSSISGVDIKCPCSLTSATVVTQGNDAQILFRALSESYPSLVAKSGRLGLQPEVDLPNISCGLQVISHGNGPVTPAYQCYTNITLP